MLLGTHKAQPSATWDYVLPGSMSGTVTLELCPQATVYDEGQL